MTMASRATCKRLPEGIHGFPRKIHKKSIVEYISPLVIPIRQRLQLPWDLRPYFIMPGSTLLGQAAVLGALRVKGRVGSLFR